MADIEAEIHFLSTDTAGRRAPVTSGYRPQFYYDNQDWDAVHEYVGVEWVKPGETAMALISFLSPEAHIGRIHAGMPFLIREGNKTIAYGVVKAILELKRGS